MNMNTLLIIGIKCCNKELIESPNIYSSSLNSEIQSIL